MFNANPGLDVTPGFIKVPILNSAKAGPKPVWKKEEGWAGG